MKMQSLGVSPLKADSCAVFNHGERNCHRRNALGVGYSARVCFLMMSSTNSLVNLRCGCSNYSIGLGLGFFKPKRCSFGSPFALTVEQQEGIGVTVDDSGENRVDIEPDKKIDVRALAHSLRSAKTADDVEEVLKQQNVELPLKVFSAMIKGLARDNLMDSAMALVEYLNAKKKETDGAISANSFIYNSLLFAVKLSKRFDLLGKIMQDMAKQGIEPDLVTYNSLMAIYVEQGRASKALNILEKIQNSGLGPSPVTYSTAMTAYRQTEDGFGALKFFAGLREKFKNGDITKDDNDQDWETELAKLEDYTTRICYQVMRRWLVNTGDLNLILPGNVVKLLAEMDKVGIELGRSELERLVWACTREEHYTVGKELYVRIRGTDSQISLSVCNHLIWLMGKARKWWAALELYEDLLDKGPKPNTLSHELIVSHFNVLLTSARKKGIWKWGLKLLEKMEEKGFKPGTKEWNAVLIACSKASEAAAAIEIFKRMVENGLKPTIVSYGALLSALEKGKLYDEAIRVWDHLVKVGAEPNVYTYTTMASILTGQGDFEKLDALLKEMSSLGIEPTVVTYNAIISRCGFGNVAYEWFDRMKVQGVAPNEVTYEMLIEALGKDGKPRLAYDLYLGAKDEGLRLSRKAYDAVVASVKEYGASVDLSLLGPQPMEKWLDAMIKKKNNAITRQT